MASQITIPSRHPQTPYISTFRTGSEEATSKRERTRILGRREAIELLPTMARQSIPKSQICGRLAASGESGT